MMFGSFAGGGAGASETRHSVPGLPDSDSATRRYGDEIRLTRSSSTTERPAHQRRGSQRRYRSMRAEGRLPALGRGGEDWSDGWPSPDWHQLSRRRRPENGRRGGGSPRWTGARTGARGGGRRRRPRKMEVGYGYDVSSHQGSVRQKRRCPLKGGHQSRLRNSWGLAAWRSPQFSW